MQLGFKINYIVSNLKEIYQQSFLYPMLKNNKSCIIMFKKLNNNNSLYFISLVD